ncbi:MAG: hypothetical protein JST45_13650 [Bacteroidetes bacterium]|nr:hypothetical protein [Bacteroidota bacterium]
MEASKTKRNKRGASAHDAPWITDKEMPPYGMGRAELVYPGEGSPFTSISAENGPTGGPHQPGTPPHPAAPPTEVPQNKVHPGAAATVALLQSLTACATACERCIEGCRSMNEQHRYADCNAAARACADICILLHSYISAADRTCITLIALDLAPVCARVCETCALECSKHPGMETCTTCEQACRACATDCRTFAR